MNMGERKGVSNEPKSRHRPEREGVFSDAMRQLRQQWGFNYQGLGGSLSKTDRQELSRLSANGDAFLSLSPSRLSALLERTGSSVVGWVQNRGRIDPDLIPLLESRIKSTLAEAAKREIEIAEEKPLAAAIGRKLAEISGRSLFELDLMLDDPSLCETISEVLNKKGK